MIAIILFLLFIFIFLFKMVIYSIGTDIAHIPRFAKILSRYGDRFLNKICNEIEIKELKSLCSEHYPRFIASRFALND